MITVEETISIRAPYFRHIVSPRKFAL
jgi:hypothetical protein